MFVASICLVYSWWENRKENKATIAMMMEMHEKEKGRLYDTIDAFMEEFKVIHANNDITNQKLDDIKRAMAKEVCACGDKVNGASGD